MSERRLALVTGASRRIGREIAIDLARHGFDLLLTFRESAKSCAETARLAIEAAKGSTPTIFCHRVDFDSMDDLERFLRELGQLPRLDAIIHNASLYEPSSLSAVTAEDLLRQYRVHVVAPLLLTRHLLPAMRASTLPNGAAIIALTDMHVLHQPRPGVLAYSLAKAALTEAVLCLARELGPTIRVNGIAPGLIDAPPDLDDAQTKRYIDRTPIGREGTAKEVASLVRWLVIEGSFVTGEIIRVDGGRHLQ